jgi:hypothetical protein
MADTTSRSATGLETVNLPTQTPTEAPPPLPEAVIRAYDAKKDQKLVRYLIGAGVMEP